MVKAALHNSPLLLLSLLCSFLLNKTILAGNNYIAATADQLLTGQTISLSPILAPLLKMIGFGTLCAYAKAISGKYYSSMVQRDVRLSLGNHLLQLPYSYFDEKGTGSILTRLISDIGEMGRFFAETLPNLLANIIAVATATIYLIQMDPLLIAVLFAGYPVMLAAAERLSKKLAEITKKLRTQMDTCAEKAYDAIQGITVGRSYNLYQLQKQQIDTAIDQMVTHACQSTRISSLGWVLKNIITTLPVILCYLFALYEITRGRITIGDMLAFILILNRILYPISDIVFCASDIREASVSLKRIQEIQCQPGERTSGHITKIPENQKEIPAIQWNNVDFSYTPDQDHPVINHMTFTISAGQQIAFVGGSGEGKTTIFKLLCGLYQQTGGQYALFGHDFRHWSLKAARNCFSLVSQNVFLFPETIRQNVACGKEHSTEKEIIEACKNANIHDYIMSLPQGYETLAGERGIHLSGGQRQRISIARAFLKDAPILLLDEPTSSVDIEAEQKIQEAIERISKGRTVIIIAHRLSTIKQVKQIYVISNGTIAESGNHRELLEKHGIYAQLYTSTASTRG